MKNNDLDKLSKQELKERAELSIQKGKGIILQNIPNEEIIAIYIKGSYVQDELRPDSDVDLVVILKSEKYLSSVYKLSEDFGNLVLPPFSTSVYTLDELYTGKLSIKRISDREKHVTPVKYFSIHFIHFPLIFGSKPEGKLFTRNNDKNLLTQVSVFKKMFLPAYNNGTFKFDGLVKQALWLSEIEQRVLGYTPEYNWQKLADSVKDKNNIVHDALKLRRQTEIFKKKQDEFIKKLNDYLDFLENKYKQ